MNINRGAADIPAASNVQINGTFNTGQTVTGTYQYEGTTGEGGSVYTWYASEFQSGQDGNVIATATNHYTIDDALAGKYLFFEVQPIDQQGAAGVSVMSDSFGGTAASIGATEPVILAESSANDGSLDPGTIVITIADGTLAEDTGKTDVTATNLPAGLDYSVSRTDATHLSVQITGNAISHTNADDMPNLFFTIAGSKVAGAANDLTTADIAIDFNDPATTYTLTINVTGQGSVSKNPDRQGYEADAVVQLTATASDGWSFSGWSGDLTCNVNPVVITMNGDRTVNAVFSADSFPVSFNPQGGSDIDSQTVAYNELVVEPVAPDRNGYSLTGWYHDATCTRAWSFDTDRVTGETIIYAGWSRPVGNGGLDGQAQMDITSVQLGDSESLGLQAGVQSADGTQIVIGGVTEDLGNYSGGNLNGANLTEPQNIGGCSVDIQQAVRLESGEDGTPVTLTNTGNSDISIAIPDGTTIMADSNWDGTLSAPKEVTGCGTAPSGFAVGGLVIEAGSPASVLLFDKPVILELKGVTGPVGYKPAGSDTWANIDIQAGGTYENPVAPDFPGEAFISNGIDTKIVTWHLTGFAPLLVTPAAPANPVVDDSNDTFGWTDTPGYAGISEYEISINGGTTWADCTANPQPVGNFNYAPGVVRVRVKENAAESRTTGDALLSHEAFTSAPAATVTTVHASINPAEYGQTINFIAAVTSSEGTPAGTAGFTIDGAAFGGAVVLSGGSATSNAISSLAPGNHVIMAAFNGSPDFAASTGTFTQTIYYIPPAPASPTEPVTTETPDSNEDACIYTTDLIVSSPDNHVSLFIAEGVTGKTAEGKPLESISVTPVLDPPAPPEGSHVIGIAYRFQPEGATFEPPAVLTFTFDASGLSPDTQLIIAWFDVSTGKWVECEDCVIDWAAHTVTAKVKHFTNFAILGIKAPGKPVTETPVTAPSGTIASVTPKPAITNNTQETTATAGTHVEEGPAAWLLSLWIIGGLATAALLIVLYFKRRRD